jgi:hypothetical protein
LGGGAGRPSYEFTIYDLRFAILGAWPMTPAVKYLADAAKGHSSEEFGWELGTIGGRHAEKVCREALHHLDGQTPKVNEDLLRRRIKALVRRLNGKHRANGTKGTNGGIA